MFLIDYPYVSNFLKDTIAKKKYPVIQTKEALELLKNKNINWITSAKAVTSLKNHKNFKLYTNSENSIDWVFKNLEDTNQAKWIEIFKDKFAFRELIKDIYPDFFFKKITIKKIQTLDVKKYPFPFVIKPSIGFFSLGVHIVNNLNEWNTIKKQLQPENLKHIYPDNVINTSSFIIEAYIEGKEYAVDCYFNEKGKPIIQNILLHKFASKTDVSDRVYYTSKEIIEQYHDKLSLFLSKIGDKMLLKNFPLHIEIKINKDDKITPIEVNPMRFGGWCTTADLAWFAYQFNPYINFMENKSPDWEFVLDGRENYKYAIIILSTTTEIQSKNIRFDYKKLTQQFEKIIHIRKLDYKKYNFFGFAFIATKNETELDAFLASDLSEYIIN
ncbi:MAG TPA: ATP-grasp domain-containing protein [Flavobacteriia bacterium]|nr:ATP-grasp domain-containing protein [Flavobacteriia bacterium]